LRGQDETNRQDLQAAFIEMFSRVGLDYTYDEIRAYADADPDWYWSKTWTQADEDDFRKWLADKFYKSEHFRVYSAKARKKIVEKEVGYFMLMWGWKTDVSR